MTAQVATEIQVDKAQWLQALELWKGSMRCANTQRAYVAGLQDLLATSGKALWEILPADVISWVEGLRKRGLAETTVQLRLCGASSFCRFAFEECGLGFAGGRLPTSGRSLRRKVEPYGKATWLSADETKALLGAIDRTSLRGKRDYALLLGYLMTGRRNSEWRLARRCDFDTRGGVVKYRWSGKGKTDQRQEMPGPVWKAVEDLIRSAKTGKEGYLFTALDGFVQSFKGRSNWRPGSALSAREVGRIVKKYARLAGLDAAKVHVHTLRHTAAMLRKETGAGLEEEMVFLGHSNLAITQIYVHSLEGRKDESWMKVSDLLGL